MSDVEGDVDGLSDGEDSLGTSKIKGGNNQDKRAHHNALERKRRDHIKESFNSLRDAIPTIQGGDKSSRAQILKKSSEYISYMKKKNAAHSRDVEDLKGQNKHIEQQIKALEKAKATGQFTSAAEVLERAGLNYDPTTDRGGNSASPAIDQNDHDSYLEGSDNSNETHPHVVAAPQAIVQKVVRAGSTTARVLTNPAGATVTLAGAGAAGAAGATSIVQPGQSLLIVSPQPNGTYIATTTTAIGRTPNSATSGEPTIKRFRS